MINKLGQIFNKKFRGIFILIVILILLPFIVRNNYFQYILILSMLYAVVASNWDLTFGYFGMFNFGHVAIFVSGGYVAAILSKFYGISPWVSIILASLFSAILCSIIVLPMLRVKGIYVVLITYGFSQLLYQFILSQRNLTGGSLGIDLIPDIYFGNYSFAQNGKIAYYFLAFFLLIASTLFLTKLVKSKFGLSVIALKDYEEYAVSRGVNFGRQLILCFGASALFTGAAGAVMAFYLGALSPSMLGFGYLIIILSSILVGGINTIYGSIVGALILVVVSELLVNIGAWRFIIIACLIIFIMRFFPKGIYPSVSKLYKRYM